MHWGIDLGGTKIEIIGLASHSEERYRRRIPAPRGSYADTLSAICDLISQAEQETQQAGSIGIGIPGCIDPLTQRVKNANSTWLIGEPLQYDLENKLARPVVIANDADCFTLSEAMDGAGKAFHVVFGVILGTGVGGGLAIAQQVSSGPNSIRGEWGHNPLPWLKQGERQTECYCGKKGCIETFLSGPGLLHQYQQHHDAAHDAPDKPHGVEDLLSLSQGGNALAQQALANYPDQLGRALASVINVLDPDCIVLGGGLSNMHSLYEDIRAPLDEYVFSSACHTPVVPARHGDSSGVRGAAWLGMQQHV